MLSTKRSYASGKKRRSNRGESPCRAEALEERKFLSVSFQTQQTYAVGTQPNRVVIADLGNGRQDLVVTNTGVDAGVRELLGNGDGTFQPSRVVSSSLGSPFSLAVADLGNGHPDLIVGDATANAIDVFLGNGNGTFQNPANYLSPGPSSIAVANLGGSGHTDVLVTEQGQGGIATLQGNGNGTLQGPAFVTTGSQPVSLAVADLGNGHPDVVVLNSGDDTVSVLIGNGFGGFLSQHNTYTVGAGARWVTVADLGNGHPDIITANQSGNNVSVLLGNGDGTFQRQITYATGASPTAVVVADLGNGHPDIITSNSADNTVSVLEGNGNGFFQPKETFSVGVGPTDVAVADLGNGHPDIVTTNSQSGTVSVLLGGAPGGGAGGGSGSVTSLTATVVGRLPKATLVAGQRIAPITQFVKLTNSSATPVRARVTADLLLSADATGASGGTPVAQAKPFVIVPAHRSVSIPLVDRRLPDDLTGTLSLVASVTDSAGNTIVAPATGSITVAAPFVDLSGSIVRVPAKSIGGRTTFAIVSVMENGNVPVTGKLTSEVFASANGVLDANSIDLGPVTRIVAVPADRRGRVNLVAKLPKLTPGSYTLFVQLDPNNLRGDTDLSNNLLGPSNELVVV